MSMLVNTPIFCEILNKHPLTFLVSKLNFLSVTESVHNKCIRTGSVRDECSSTPLSRDLHEHRVEFEPIRIYPISPDKLETKALILDGSGSGSGSGSRAMYSKIDTRTTYIGN